MTTREFMESRTELELHLLQWFKETGEPMDIEFYRHAGDSFHCLDEFIDGYGRKENGFSTYNFNGDEDLEIRINKFLQLAQKDREDQSYSSSNFEFITELIDELGL